MIDNNFFWVKAVSDYYERKIQIYGETARGVDWNSEQSQNLRFEKLCKVIEINNGQYTINDLGCGYGALLDYLNTFYKPEFYYGIDVSKEMIKSAVSIHENYDNCSFLVGCELPFEASYSVASGIFNVRLDFDDDSWLVYVVSTLDELFEKSTCGFSVNFLTSYSDDEKKKDYLYYADPMKIFELCKQRYSRNVALLHDYDLYEFTVIVRKVYE